MLRKGDVLRAEFFREMPIDQTIVFETAEFDGVDSASVLPALGGRVVDGRLRSPAAIPALAVGEELCDLIERGHTITISEVEPKRVQFEVSGDHWQIRGSFKKGDLAY